MTAPTTAWATADAVRSTLAAKWDRGAILRELHLSPEDRKVFPMRVRLTGPTAAELGERFTASAEWARDLHDASVRSGWALRTRRVRVGAGMQNLPAAAIVDTPERAVLLLGDDYRRDADTFAVAVAAATEFHPEARALALALPLDVVAAGDDWPLLLAAARWLQAHPRPNVYVRQMPLPGVHTKVIETHRTLLTKLLDAVLPGDAVDRTAVSFERRFGFREPARRSRIRGASAVLGVPLAGVADVTWDVDALASLNPAATGVVELLVVENQTSFLTVPVPAGRLVLWGAGYGVDGLLAALPWRHQVRVRYWGDLDTHGFVILSRVRAVAPHTTSVLMDEDTLLAHRDFWAREAKPRIDALPNLTDDEARLYAALCAGSLGPSVRLEQEFLRFDRVEAALGTVDAPATR